MLEASLRIDQAVNKDSTLRLCMKISYTDRDN
jgi:hypothetical protein